MMGPVNSLALAALLAPLGLQTSQKHHHLKLRGRRKTWGLNKGSERKAGGGEGTEIREGGGHQLEKGTKKEARRVERGSWG